MTLEPVNSIEVTSAHTAGDRRHKRAAMGLAMLGFAVVALDAQITMLRCLRFIAAWETA